MTRDAAPTLYLIAGPNGAGKSSLAGSLLPRTVPAERFINPDVVATALDPAHPERAARMAGRRALERVRAFEHSQMSFALETTLSGQWTARLARGLLSSGWSVDLTWLWLPSADDAVERVSLRASRSGGHAIPAAIVRRRYVRGLIKLDLLRTSMTRWRVLDRRSLREAAVIAEGGHDVVGERVHDAEAWREVLRTIEGARQMQRRTSDEGGGGRVSERARSATITTAGTTRMDGDGIDRSDGRLQKLLREELDVAIAVADRATVLRHRALGVPLLFCKGGGTVEVDPWTVPLPRIPEVGDGME